ncbi:hypothetical protein [Tenacibaculum sp. nBUS_03]|uniref:hypothetical protein n=1 Tax=Tenacibaculum sp. nBUS_03 TaxID=3395320 RepID=UPI003EBFF595
MKITQRENGNIIIQDNQNNIKAIMPYMFIFPHPRIGNSILINASGSATDENNSFEVSVEKGVFLNGNKITNIEGLFDSIAKNIQLNGTKNTEPKQNTDPQKDVFDTITDFETMYNFAKAFNSHTFPIIKDSNGKIVKEDYLLQFTTVVLTIQLSYYYFSEAPNKISHISMGGNISNIAFPVKTYQYGANNVLTHTYESYTWQR